MNQTQFLLVIDLKDKLVNYDTMMRCPKFYQSYSVEDEAINLFFKSWFL